MTLDWVLDFFLNILILITTNFFRLLITWQIHWMKTSVKSKPYREFNYKLVESNKACDIKLENVIKITFSPQ